VSATDGYSFFITRGEIFSNPDLILTYQEVGNKTLFNIVGAYSSKAWIRGVNTMKVIGSGQIQIFGRVNNPFIFQPHEWMGEMDSTFLKFGDETAKLQGVAIRSLWNYAQPFNETTSIVFISNERTINIPLSDFVDSDDIRIFTLLSDEGMEFVLGKMNGEVITEGIQSIEIK
jgi:hypothetical protein